MIFKRKTLTGLAAIIMGLTLLLAPALADPLENPAETEATGSTSLTAPAPESGAATSVYDPAAYLNRVWQPDTPVKVGYFLYEGFQEQDAAGTLSGLSYDYLQALARHTGWSYEYISLSWQRGLEMLATGDIDLLGGLQYTPERAIVYDFAATALGDCALSLAVLDDSALTRDNAPAYKGMLVGNLHGANQEDLLAWSDRHNTAVQIADYPTQAAMLTALANRQLDAVVTAAWPPNSTLRIVAELAVRPCYYATAKGNYAFYEELNRGIAALNAAEPGLVAELYQQYYGGDGAEPAAAPEPAAPVAAPAVRGAINPAIWMTGSAVLLMLTLVLLALLLRKNRFSREAEEKRYRDVLTGLPDYTRFLRQAAPLMSAHANHRYALVYFDMEPYKPLCASYGYEEGIRLLRLLSQQLQAFILPHELSARVDASNYVMLLDSDDPLQLELRLEQLAGALEQYSAVASPGCRLTFKGGVYPMENGVSPELGLRCADLAREHIRYDAALKFAWYDDQLGQAIDRGRSLENTLKSGIEREELVISYSPRIAMATGHIIGADALVWWNHPLYGWLTPDDFMPALEKSAAAAALERFVAENICQLLRQWLDRGQALIPLACPLSRHYLAQPEVIEFFTATAERYQIPCEMLEFKLDEPMVAEHLTLIEQPIRQLHRQGFSLALNNYGSAGALLELTRIIPLDTLILDPDFVARGQDSPLLSALSAAVIRSAQESGITVLGRGVTTGDQAEELRLMGCAAAQGPYYGEPLTADELTARLNA